VGPDPTNPMANIPTTIGAVQGCINFPRGAVAASQQCLFHCVCTALSGADSILPDVVFAPDPPDAAGNGNLTPGAPQGRCRSDRPARPGRRFADLGPSPWAQTCPPDLATQAACSRSARQGSSNCPQRPPRSAECLSEGPAASSDLTSSQRRKLKSGQASSAPLRSGAATSERRGEKLSCPSGLPDSVLQFCLTIEISSFHPLLWRHFVSSQAPNAPLSIRNRRKKRPCPKPRLPSTAKSRPTAA
jgi:hypothetical protein